MNDKIIILTKLFFIKEKYRDFLIHLTSISYDGKKFILKKDVPPFEFFDLTIINDRAMVAFWDTKRAVRIMSKKFFNSGVSSFLSRKKKTKK